MKSTELSSNTVVLIISPPGFVLKVIEAKKTDGYP